MGWGGTRNQHLKNKTDLAPPLPENNMTETDSDLGYCRGKTRAEIQHKVKRAVKKVPDKVHTSVYRTLYFRPGYVLSLDLNDSTTEYT